MTGVGGWQACSKKEKRSQQVQLIVFTEFFQFVPSRFANLTGNR